MKKKHDPNIQSSILPKKKSFVCKIAVDGGMTLWNDQNKRTTEYTCWCAWIQSIVKTSLNWLLFPLIYTISKHRTLKYLYDLCVLNKTSYSTYKCAMRANGARVPPTPNWNTARKTLQNIWKQNKSVAKTKNVNHSRPAEYQVVICVGIGCVINGAVGNSNITAKILYARYTVLNRSTLNIWFG